VDGDGAQNGPGGRYLLFVWSTQGYALREREGELPPVGELVEDGEQRYRVSKHAPSQLPGDRRRCAYLLPA
jgi:hypothetical protein